MDQIISIDTSLIPTIWEIIKSIPSQGGQWLTEELANNDFLIATVVPAILLAVWYMFRGFIGMFITYLKMAVTSEITFNSDNNYYHEITQYLYDKSLAKIFQRFFTISYSWETEKLILTIGYGTSIGFIDWWPVIITRATEDSQSAKFKETVTIKIIGGRTSAINTLMKSLELTIGSLQTQDLVAIYQIDKDGDMMRTASKPRRSMDTVIIPEEDKAYILEKLDRFMESEEYYVSKGLPYHMGIILSGPPGTGKTSLIHALASHYKRNICFSTGDKIHTGGMDLKSTILVIEDIDVSGLTVAKRQDDERETSGSEAFMKAIVRDGMSNLLNTLDGLLSPHGLITIATTNRYDSLDPAVVRPGRFDVHLEFKNMAWPEWLGLCKLLDRTTAVTEEQYSVISPAQARYMLLYYSDDDIRGFFTNPTPMDVSHPPVLEVAATMGTDSGPTHVRGRRHRG